MCGRENERKCTDKTRKTFRKENPSRCSRSLPFFEPTHDCLSATAILSLCPAKTNRVKQEKKILSGGKQEHQQTGKDNELE